MRVLVADDHAMVRGALVALLELEDDITVVGQVGTGTEVLAAARSLGADVVVLDHDMPGRDGIEVTAQLAEELPGCRVVVLTGFERPGLLRRAMSAGARGFLVKSAHAAGLAPALRRVMAGELVVDERLAAQALSGGACPLTDRQLDVLRAGAHGQPLSEVAAALHLAPGTVKNYVSAVLTVLGVRNRAEAVAMAVDRGWL
ncbi:response regulator transcription factor [Pseudokineococcus sp. 1T1Z-3]|uniref:response regulator transcription factor n=1 Tax=Pseudokineococcus sp. 1T1Z-3 TaxID=3132745 RepID=UPI0030A721D2